MTLEEAKYVLDQFDEHPVCAETASLGHGANPSRYSGGKAGARSTI